MKESEVGQEAEFFREGAGNIAVVEVNACYHGEVRVVRCLCAEDAGVAADVGSHPVRGEAFWVGCYLVFPCLESYESLLEARIGERRKDLLK